MDLLILKFDFDIEFFLLLFRTLVIPHKIILYILDTFENMRDTIMMLRFICG